MNYLVWPADESRNEAIRISAVDAQAAAEEWAEWADRTSVEYDIIRSGDLTEVYVALDEPGSVEELFNVWGEGVPVYTASKVRG